MRGILVVLGFSALLTLDSAGCPSFCIYQGDPMSSKKQDVDLQGVNTDFIQQGNDVIRKHTQTISQSFLDDLKDSRNASKDQREGEFMRVASIPTIVVEQWLREGFNIWEATGPEIVKRLRDQNLEGFMATEKRI